MLTSTPNWESSLLMITRFFFDYFFFVVVLFSCCLLSFVLPIRIVDTRGHDLEDLESNAEAHDEVYEFLDTKLG